MNILFVTENLFPDVMGGSGRVVTETGSRLAARGHSVHVITRLVAGTGETGMVRGMSVSRYACRAGVGRTIMAVSRALDRRLEAGRVDAAVICQPLPGMAAVRSSGLRNVPLVRDFHGPWHEEYRVKTCGWGTVAPLRIRLGMAARMFADRYVLKRVDRVRVLSEYTAAMVRDLCPGIEDRIICVPGGVDTERFAPATDQGEARKRVGVPPGRIVVFTVRNLSQRMGLDVLIDAMKSVSAQIRDVLLLVGGDGPMRAALEERIEKNGLSGNVRLVGAIPDCDLPDYYRSADVFVLPTQDLEGFGLVTLEAMASGLPVLATPQGGSLEILGQYGTDFLFEGKDADAMAAGIMRLTNSRERMTELGRKARVIAVARSWDRQTDAVELLLQDLVRAGR